MLSGDEATGETAVRMAAYVFATGDPARDLAVTAADEKPYLFIAARELPSSCRPLSMPKLAPVALCGFWYAACWMPGDVGIGGGPPGSPAVH